MNEIITKFKRYGWEQLFHFILSELRLKCIHQWILNSYSQNKEDLILDTLLKGKKKGFYVDVGAYDPVRFSNTMRFYKKGWFGINIEPDSERYQRFIKIRPRDINCNIGIAQKREILYYYRLDPPTLSTFIKAKADEYKRQGFILKSTEKIPVLPLKDVLKKYIKGNRIDFMSIDVEGMEIDVVKSNDWKLFRPLFLCLESADYVGAKKGSKRDRAVDSFLKTVGYRKIYDNGLNSIYKHMRQV